MAQSITKRTVPKPQKEKKDMSTLENPTDLERYFQFLCERFMFHAFVYAKSIGFVSPKQMTLDDLTKCFRHVFRSEYHVLADKLAHSCFVSFNLHVPLEDWVEIHRGVFEEMKKLNLHVPYMKILKHDVPLVAQKFN